MGAGVSVVIIIVIGIIINVNLIIIYFLNLVGMHVCYHPGTKGSFFFLLNA